MSTTDFLSPLALSATVTPIDVATLGQPDNGTPSSAQQFRILNPNRMPMLIDQIRFSAQVGVADYTAGFQYTETLFNVLADIKLGSIPLTKGLMPIAAICPSYNPAQISLVSDSQVQLGNRNNFFYTNYVSIWHLPKPLYVPPNVQLTCDMLNVPAGMRCVIIGRSVPSGWPIPPKIYVPWASCVQVSDPTQDLLNFESGTSELVNPHDQPLRVTRFLGGRSISDQSNSAQSNPERRTFTARMSLSNGKTVVRDPVPFYTLFPPIRRYFDIDALLQPKEFVRVFMQQPYGSGGVALGLDGMYVSMIGYRELQTPGGSKP